MHGCGAANAALDENLRQADAGELTSLVLIMGGTCTARISFPSGSGGTRLESRVEDCRLPFEHVYPVKAARLPMDSRG